VVSIGFGWEDREMADIDWAVGQREKDIGPVAVQEEMGSLDSVGKSPGPRTDY